MKKNNQKVKATEPVMNPVMDEKMQQSLEEYNRTFKDVYNAIRGLPYGRAKSVLNGVLDHLQYSENVIVH